MPKTVALFGGSFNPPHDGHYEIARRLARRRGVDEVWILPVYRHVFGKRMASFAKRLRDARRFFGPLAPKVKVSGLERRLGGPSYTIRLIRHLKKAHPSWKFLLAIGSDNYRLRRQWKDFEAIRREAGLLVMPRGRRSTIPNVSSTAIRARKGGRR